MSKTVDINVFHAVREFKYNSLILLENWIASCGENTGNRIKFQDFNSNGLCFPNVRINSRSCLLSSDAEIGSNTCSVPINKEWGVLWKDLACSRNDLLLKISPVFAHWAKLLYHQKVVAFITLISVYYVIVLFVTASINPSSVGLCLIKLETLISFWALFVLASRVFRGSLSLTESLSPNIPGAAIAMELDTLNDSNWLTHYFENRAQSTSSDVPAALRDVGVNINQSIDRSESASLVRSVFFQLSVAVVSLFSETRARQMVNTHNLRVSGLAAQADGSASRLSAKINTGTSELKGVLGFYQLLNVGYKYLSMFDVYKKQSYIAGAGNDVDSALHGLMLFIILLEVVFWITSLETYHENCFSDNSDRSNQYCYSMKVEIYMTLGFALEYFISLVLSISIMICFCAFIHGARISNGLIELFINRYKMTRNLVVVDDKQQVEMDESCEHLKVGDIVTYFEDFTMNNYDEYPLTFDCSDSLKILSLLQTDAKETFLFRQEIMQQSTNVWNGFLFVLFLVFVCIIVDAVLFPTLSGNDGGDIGFSLFVVLVMVVIMFFPMICIASANSSLSDLIQLLSSSGLDDFKVIGGRKKWLNYVQTSSVYWGILGIPITYKVIISGLSTMGAFILYISGQSVIIGQVIGSLGVGAGSSAA